MIAVSFDAIEKASCIKFRPATTADKDWVEIDSTQSGCFADLGFLGPGKGKHELNIEIGTDQATCLTKSVVVHELLHNLGVNHEQTRPDRDEYMTINWTNMKV